MIQKDYKWQEELGHTLGAVWVMGVKMSNIVNPKFCSVVSVGRK